MKMILKPIQSRILMKLGTAHQLSFTRLVYASLPSHKDQDSLSYWENEIRLQIELLKVYGLIQIVEKYGVRICIAPEFVVRWVPENLDQLAKTQNGKPYRPAIILPLLAASLVTVATACSNLPGRTHSTPIVARYNADGTAPPERMEQFFNSKSKTMVYRFCVGDECPTPTPKKPKQTMAVVNEIENGITVQNPPARTVQKTAQSNNNSAAIVAKLEQQRRTIMVENGAPPALPKQENTPSQVSRKLVPQLPSTGTRVPVGPQAAAIPPTETEKALAITGPMLVAGITLRTDGEFTSHKGMVGFQNGSMVLDGINRQKIAEMAPMAREAERIRLRGRVASSHLSEDMKQLAIGRAYAVKIEFAKYNVDKAKIRILSPQQPSGENATGTVRGVDVMIDMPSKSVVGTVPEATTT